MPKHEEDQCVQCGAIRVASSDLCPQCLVRLCEIRLTEIDRLEDEKLLLHDKLQQALRLVEKLLDHISSEAAYTSEVRLELRKAKRIIKAG